MADITPIARIETPFAEKFGVPRQSGVAACPGHGETPEELLAAADGAMYVVKYGGKNGARLADRRG